MRMKLRSEQDILDQRFRSAVIDEITSTENVDRKNRMLKRYEVYKDNTKKWVMENLAKELLKGSTLAAMENRAANVSICGKIINKLARCYMGGVERVVSDEKSQEAIDEISRLMMIDKEQKKADRYRQLFKNAMIYIKPMKRVELGEDRALFDLTHKVLAPYLYDVIEDPNDREKAKVIILTDFVERNRYRTGIRVGEDGRGKGIVPQFHEGNRIDEIIADERSDAGGDEQTREFIWWSDSFHFTTDAKGRFIEEKTPQDLLNPIQTLPFIKVSEDQDDEFWAEGGDDLIDGSILVNVLLTDMNSIAYNQGWGQLVLTGTNLPDEVRVGPHTALKLEHEPDAPIPTVTFATANAPIDTWMRMAEQLVALILSTNDLSPGNISGKLDPSNFASGIAKLIEQSEHTGSIEDKQKLFQDVERQMWDVIARWQNLLMSKNSLVDDFKNAGLITDSDVSVVFKRSKPAISEKEKLDNIKLRKELGINTMAELVQLDNPDLTYDQAIEKLAEIQAERQERVAAFIANGTKAPEQQDEENKQEEAPKTEEDSA